MTDERVKVGGTAVTIVNVDSIDDRRAEIEHLVATDGAVMLHGLGVDSPERFHEVVSTFGVPFTSYRGGNTPRKTLSEGVFTSTEYPAEYEISMHNEMSYASRWPERLYFSCLIAAETGGATPVADGRALLADLPDAVRDRFERLGVVYRQFLHGGFGFGKSWQQTFETEDRAEVEEFLHASDAEYAWTADGDLRVAQRRAGTQTHPATGEKVWFNQADQWHPSNLPPEEAELILSLVDSNEDLAHWVTYGDGSPIAEDDLAAVRAAASRNKVAIPWQAGDFMLIDNMLVLHGRQAYTGNRRVVVAMT
jgi:alpha-ketoglutarate-dependent taurine dioxygenase